MKVKRPSATSESESSPPKKVKKSIDSTDVAPSPKKKGTPAGGDKKKNFSKPLKPKPLLKNGNNATAKVANLQEKPEDWNEFKKKKKELFVKRKQSVQKGLYDVILRAKQIGEKLRLKKLEGGNEERSALIKELHEAMSKNGGYVKFVLSHDMARIVQYMLKFGSVDIREYIANDIIPETIQMLQSKYGKFCIKRMLKYGNATVRAKCIKATYGKAVKLTSHAVSAPVFEFAYSMYASPADKVALIQEFFGDVYKQTKDTEVKHLRDVYKNNPELKAAALSSTKANLSRILDKSLLDSGLVQSVISQYLTECSTEDRTELISQLAPHIVVLSNSKDGARVAMQCIWHGTNKDRKTAMKALKEHAVELCKHEHGHTMILALLDSADDTVLLNKMILSDILEKAEELVADDWGRKVILWLVDPADTVHFHPLFIKELETGRKESSCKKEVAVRRKELLKYSVEGLLGKVTAEAKAWLEQPSKAVVTLAILKSGVGDELNEALKSLSEVIADAEWKVTHEEKEILAIEHPGVHMTLKKLAQNDKKLTEEGTTTFGETLVNYLNDDNIISWIKINRGCFLLIAIFENNSKDVQNKIKELVSTHSKTLKKQNHMGAKILKKKLDG